MRCVVGVRCFVLFLMSHKLKSSWNCKSRFIKESDLLPLKLPFEGQVQSRFVTFGVFNFALRDTWRHLWLLLCLLDKNVEKL